MKNLTTLGLSFALALVASTSSAATKNFKATLTGAQQVPAVTTTATGSATGVYDDVTKVFSYTVTHTIPSGNVTAGHIHFAPAGKNGSNVFDLANGGKSVSTGTTTPLDSTSETNLLAGNLYFNIHTTANGGGELRGQIEEEVADAGSATIDSGTSSADDGGSTATADSGDTTPITSPADGGGSTGTTPVTTGDDDAAEDESSCSMGHTKSAGAFSFGLLALGLAALVRSKKSKR